MRKPSFKGRTIQCLKALGEVFLVFKYMKKMKVQNLNNIKALYTFFFLLKFPMDFFYTVIYTVYSFFSQ